MARPKLTYDGVLKKPRELSLTKNNIEKLTLLIDRGGQGAPAEGRGPYC